MKKRPAQKARKTRLLGGVYTMYGCIPRKLQAHSVSEKGFLFCYFSLERFYSDYLKSIHSIHSIHRSKKCQKSAKKDMKRWSFEHGDTPIQKSPQKSIHIVYTRSTQARAHLSLIEHIRQHTTGGSKSREGKLAGPIRIPFKLKLVSGGAILAHERF